jgi:hypothetical protein
MVRYLSIDNKHPKIDFARKCSFKNLKVFISEYYKGLFGAPPPNNFTLLEDRIEDIPQLSSEEKKCAVNRLHRNGGERSGDANEKE